MVLYAEVMTFGYDQPLKNQLFTFSLRFAVVAVCSFFLGYGQRNDF